MVGAIGFRPNRGVLVWSAPILLRATCNQDEPEQPEPAQHECAVEALHPPQRHPVPFRCFLDGATRRVRVHTRLAVRERVLVLDVGVPELALEEGFLERDLKDLARALAQPVVGRHRVTPSARARGTAAEGARVDGGVASRDAVEARAADSGGQVRARHRVQARAVVDDARREAAHQRQVGGRYANEERGSVVEAVGELRAHDRRRIRARRGGGVRQGLRRRMTLDLDRRKHGRDGEDMEEGHSDEQELQQEAPAALGVEGDGGYEGRTRLQFFSSRPAPLFSL